MKEKLAAQKQRQLGSTAGDTVGGTSLADGKGKREAQLGLEAVKQLRVECDAVIAGVSDGGSHLPSVGDTKLPILRSCYQWLSIAGS